MPTYSYHCKQCGHTTEQTRSINEQEPAEILCEKCGEKTHKLFYNAPAIFRGNGWAKNE